MPAFVGMTATLFWGRYTTPMHRNRLGIKASEAIDRCAQNAVGPGTTYAEASFSPTMPATIRPMQASRAGDADSPNSTMPSTAVPTAPIPTQTA